MFVAASQALVAHDRRFVPLQISPDLTGSMEPLVHWIDVGTEAFREPFLHETTQRHLKSPFNKLIRPVTRLAELPGAVANDPPVELAGIIFHVSRCGSTLLSQMLGTDEQNLVLAEPEPLDQLFRVGNARGGHDISQIRALIHALARQRNEPPWRCVLKLDSWHAMYAQVLRAAFPDVPWVLLYRDPSEVYASNLQVPSSQMIPGTLTHLPVGMSLMEAAQLPHERYVLIKLIQIYEAVCQLSADTKTLLIDYNMLPKQGLECVLRHLKLAPSPEIMTRMLAASRHDAKQPSLTFKPDSEAKRAYLNPQANQACAEYLLPLYQRLEQRRVDNER